MTKLIPPEKRKRPGQSGTLVAVRLQPAELARLDRWIEDSGKLLSRPEALRLMMPHYLSEDDRAREERLFQERLQRHVNEYIGRSTRHGLKMPSDRK